MIYCNRQPVVRSFIKTPRFKPFVTFYDTGNPRIHTSQKTAIPAHIPCISFRRQTDRPATTQSQCQFNNYNFTTGLPETCSKYPRVKMLVNIKKQAPRKDPAILGLPLEYEPKFSLVFPRPMTANFGTRNPKTFH